MTDQQHFRMIAIQAAVAFHTAQAEILKMFHGPTGDVRVHNEPSKVELTHKDIMETADIFSLYISDGSGPFEE